MSSAKITLIGMQSFMKAYNKDLFELLTLPAGIDKETLVDNILIKSSEFEVLYSDPELLHDIIGVFSKKWERTFSKWYEALNIEYNPLENYDRNEDWNENGTTSNNTSNNAESYMNDSGSSTSTNKVSAYNSNSFQNDSENMGVNSSNTNSNTAFTGNENGSNSNIRKGHVHGNIGVTTSQQMLQSELDIALWNLYEHITDLLLKEVCILVY